MNEAPVRLCCGARHYGVLCPDGNVMCCLCFDRFHPDQLSEDDEGQKQNVCIACALADTLVDNGNGDRRELTPQEKEALREKWTHKT